MIEDVQRHGGRDPHDVLGVPRGADREEVVRAFHRKARHGGHPDTGGDAQAFEEIVRARDVLLTRARLAPPERDLHAEPTNNVPTAAPRPTKTAQSHSPPRETSKLAIATAVLALMGPLFWPVAIAVGHLALRQINRTGQGGGTLVPVVLFFLYVLTLPILVRVLSLILIP